MKLTKYIAMLTTFVAIGTSSAPVLAETDKPVAVTEQVRIIPFTTIYEDVDGLTSEKVIQEGIEGREAVFTEDNGKQTVDILTQMQPRIIQRPKTVKSDETPTEPAEETPKETGGLNGGSTVIEQVRIIKFKTDYIADETLALGDEKEVQPGQEGSELVLTYDDGTQKVQLISEAKSQIIHVNPQDPRVSQDIPSQYKPIPESVVTVNPFDKSKPMPEPVMTMNPFEKTDNNKTKDDNENKDTITALPKTGTYDNPFISIAGGLLLFVLVVIGYKRRKL